MSEATVIWVIKGRLPDGSLVLFSTYRGTFAFVPVDEKGSATGATCWDSHVQAEFYLKAQLKLAPVLKGFGPFEIERVVGKTTGRNRAGKTKALAH